MPNKLALVDVFVHPGATAFRGARIIVGQEKRERLAILVEDVEDADVWLIDRQIVAFLEGDPVKLVRGIEDTVNQNVVKLEVRFDLRFVETRNGPVALSPNRNPNPRKRAEIRPSSASIDCLHIVRFLRGRHWRPRAGPAVPSNLLTVSTLPAV